MMGGLIGILATNRDFARIDWGSLDETLTGDEPTGEKLLSAALLLAIGVGVSFLIGHWRRRLLNQLDP